MLYDSSPPANEGKSLDGAVNVWTIFFHKTRLFRKLLEGRILDDPDNPTVAHVCEPIPYVDALAEQFYKRLVDEGRRYL